ncbi:MAG: lipopolysaccharide kinase InaA family protein [Desulfuromonadaceae bacterium]
MNPATNLVIAADVRELFLTAGFKDFADFMEMADGRHICHKRGRSVYRFEVGSRAFYLKRNRFHRVEFFKGLLRFRLFRREAVREWRNILMIRDAGIPTITPVAMGARYCFGFETASFIVSEELYGSEPLDRLLRRRLGPLRGRDRRRLKGHYLPRVADIARTLHDSGLNHQDFYLSHFYADDGEGLFLIDLQRVMHRFRVPLRYQVKDLAQLNYSAEMTGVLTRADRMRVFHRYLGVSKLCAADKILLRKILAKSGRIAKHTVKLLERRRRRGEIL